MKFEIFILILFGFLHTTCSFVGYNKYYYSSADLVDFDEDDPFFEPRSKPEEISPMELRRLKLRQPRETVLGAFTSNSDDGKVTTETTIVQNKIIILNAGGFDDENMKKQESLSRRSELQNHKTADTSFDKSPFVVSKKYFLNVMATPHTRNSWEPNFLRTVVE